LGGGSFEGHFSKKKAPKKFFTEMLATGGVGGGSSQKHFPDYQKNFPDIPHFFLNMRKIFRKYDISPGKEKKFPQIT
jgi:hypothetical protein